MTITVEWWELILYPLGVVAAVLYVLGFVFGMRIVYRQAYNSRLMQRDPWVLKALGVGSMTGFYYILLGPIAILDLVWREQ